MYAIHARSFALSSFGVVAGGWRALAAGLLVASLGAGCQPAEVEPDAGKEAVALARAELWRPAGPAAGDGRVACDERDVRAEGGALEVSTGACDVAVLTQEALVAVAPGEEIVVRAWWGPLSAPAPEQGRLRLFLGAQELWQENVPVPGRPDLRELRALIPLAAPAGTLLTFEVEDGGPNAWSLDEVSVMKSK